MRHHSQFLSFTTINFLASCASVASTETWRGELQAITGLTGRQHTQVDSAAFNLMRVFGWGEINTLPSQGRSWEGRGGSYALIWRCNINYFPKPVQLSTEPRSPVSTLRAKRGNVQKVTERDRWEQHAASPAKSLRAPSGEQPVCLPDTQLGTRVKVDAHIPLPLITFKIKRAAAALGL